MQIVVRRIRIVWKDAETPEPQKPKQYKKRSYCNSLEHRKDQRNYRLGVKTESRAEAMVQESHHRQDCPVRHAVYLVAETQKSVTELTDVWVSAICGKSEPWTNETTKVSIITFAISCTSHQSTTTASQETLKRGRGYCKRRCSPTRSLRSISIMHLMRSITCPSSFFYLRPGWRAIWKASKKIPQCRSFTAL